jgi:hypothetical protein
MTRIAFCSIPEQYTHPLAVCDNLDRVNGLIIRDERIAIMKFRLGQKCSRCHIALPDKFGRRPPYLCADCETLVAVERQNELIEQQTQEFQEWQDEANSETSEQFEYVQETTEDWYEQEEQRRAQQYEARVAHHEQEEEQARLYMEQLGVDSSLITFGHLHRDEKLSLVKNGVTTLDHLSTFTTEKLFSKIPKNYLTGDKKWGKQVIEAAIKSANQNDPERLAFRLEALNKRERKLKFKNFSKFFLWSLLLLVVSFIVLGTLQETLIPITGDAGFGLVIVVTFFCSLYVGHLISKPKY